jgi:hypothetical protein
MDLRYRTRSCAYFLFSNSSTKQKQITATTSSMPHAPRVLARLAALWLATSLPFGLNAPSFVARVLWTWRMAVPVAVVWSAGVGASSLFSFVPPVGPLLFPWVPFVFGASSSFDFEFLFQLGCSPAGRCVQNNNYAIAI